MGIYSFLEQALGVKATPRLEEIKKKIGKGEDLSEEEMAYLLDNAARYTTLKHYRDNKKLKLNREYDDVAYEVGELLGDVLAELDGVSYSVADNKGMYHLAFDHNLNGGRNHLPGIKEYVRHAVEAVHAHQDTFCKAGNSFRVIGKLGWLEKTFHIECQVTATDSFESVWAVVAGRLREAFEKEQERAKRNLEYLNK